MKLKKKVVAIFMCLIIIGTLIFSYTLVTKFAHHNCIGDECPICIQIDMALHTISNLKLMISIVPYLLALLCVFTLRCTDYVINNRTNKTLITLKVELLD